MSRAQAGFCSQVDTGHIAHHSVASESIVKALNAGADFFIPKPYDEKYLISKIQSICKKIRDDSDSWIQIEGYILKHSDATPTHGVCPECMRGLYPEYNEQSLCDSSSTTTDKRELDHDT